MPQLSANATFSGTTRWVLIAILVIILLVAVWAIRGILLLTLASVILVVLFTMPIRFLMRRGMRRGPAIILSIMFITFLVIGLAATALPELLNQFTQLATRNIPQGIQTLVERYLTSGALLEQFPFLEDVDFQNLLNTVGVQLASRYWSIRCDGFASAGWRCRYNLEHSHRDIFEYLSIGRPPDASGGVNSAVSHLLSLSCAGNLCPVGLHASWLAARHDHLDGIRGLGDVAGAGFVGH